MSNHFVIAKGEVPGTYEILNINYLEFCLLTIKEDGSIKVIAKTAHASFVLEGAEAIDLLSAMRINPPGYHPGSAALHEKEAIPI